jgi:hypothetical protein
LSKGNWRHSKGWEGFFLGNGIRRSSESSVNEWRIRLTGACQHETVHAGTVLPQGAAWAEGHLGD